MVARNQPAKLAAFEGQFQTKRGDLSLMGFPDVAAKTTRFGVAIPGLLSFLVHGDSTKPVIGLDRVPPAYWPPVLISFIAYHAMVGIGTFFIALTLFACFKLWRGRLFDTRWLMWVFVFAVLLAVAANQLGWMSAEVGRQPWVVNPRIERDANGEFALDANGLLKYRLDEGLLTNKAVSEAVDSAQVHSSIIMFGVIYLLLLAIWITVLNHKIHHGPEPAHPPSRTTASALASIVGERVDHEASITDAKT
jgi:cytochrome d ubiquinol oxidase subunit I